MTITSQILEEGPRNLTIKFINSDGTAETAALKVDLSTLSGFNDTLPTSVRIERIIYSLTGMSVQILFDATVDEIAWILTPDADNDIIFDDYPLTNNAGAGVTGDILFTTINASAGDSYSILLKLVKVYG